MNNFLFNEMKIALANTIPEHIYVHADGRMFWKLSKPLSPKGAWVYQLVGDLEWFHVCWLIEQTLTEEQWKKYIEFLWLLQPFTDEPTELSFKQLWAKFFISLNIYQRVEALCRAKLLKFFPTTK